MSKTNLILIVALACIFLANATVVAAGQLPGDIETEKSFIDSLKDKSVNNTAGGDSLGVRYRLHKGKNGYVKFAGAPSGKYFSVDQGLKGKLLKKKDVADAFINMHRKAFATDSPSLKYNMKKISGHNNNSVRYNQMYGDIEVFGAEMIVQVNPEGGVDCVISDIMTDSTALDNSTVSLSPTIDPAAAEEIAKSYVRENNRGLNKSPGNYSNEDILPLYPEDDISLETSNIELMIYDPGVLDRQGSVALVWKMEVTGKDGELIGEVVLVDAHAGDVEFCYSLIHDIKDREIYDSDNTAADPGTLIRSEGDPPSGIVDVDLAYDYYGHTYDFYFNEHGRDSIDDAGMTMSATTRYCHPSYPCPFANAFWDGVSRMYFGDGWVIDDVVGHELTHGVTTSESGLIYADESGAINESLSDMWGEWIDLTNAAGNDDPAVRWLVGEELPIGAIRDMQDPPLFSTSYGGPMPDRYNSPFYYTGPVDNGGVHHNSGVGNKLCYLLTDGDTFNGLTVDPMGYDVVADLFYECQISLLTASSNYQDLYYAIIQAADNLAMAPDDITNIQKACLAVEIAPVSSYGVVNWDQDIYACGSVATVTVKDFDLIGNGSQIVTVYSSFEAETMTLIETTGGIFTGTILLSTDAAVPADGQLQISDGDQIDVDYIDLDNGAGGVNTVATDSALIDCAPPVIINLQVETHGDIAILTVETDEQSTLEASYGLDCDNLDRTVESSTLSTSHVIEFKPLQTNTDYEYKLTLTDYFGLQYQDLTCRSFNSGMYNVLNVPGNYSTIQDAVDAAVDYDHIVVADGTYTGAGNRDIDFYGKSITLRSLNGPVNCIIDAQGAASVFNLNSTQSYDASIIGFTITGGDTASSGGGISMVGNSGNNGNIRIEGCVITSNSSYLGGGGIYGAYNNITINNCIISQNSATFSGGGIYVSNVALYVNNCTIVENVSTGSNCGGIQFSTTGSYGTIINSILWSNTGTTADQIRSGFMVTVTFSDIQGGWIRSGYNNIDIAPGFVVSDPLYHLEPDSPCINAGDPAGDYTGQTDIDLDPRVFGGKADIGADEFVHTVHNLDQDIRYMSIQDAIDNANQGDEIEVSPGTYYEHIDYKGKAITVRSIDPTDPEITATTVIDGGNDPFAPGYPQNAGAVVRFTNCEDSGSILDGFTITNAYHYAIYAYGIGCTGGVTPNIRNCVITGNYSPYTGAGVYAVFGGKPTLDNCIITGNHANINGGGIHSAYGGDAIFNNCIISDNSAGADGGGVYSQYSNPKFNNCTIVDNQATGYGGGIYAWVANSKITNSIIWGNTAAYGDQIYTQTRSTTFSFSDIQGSGGSDNWDPSFGTDGGGNIDSDPMLAAADLHLLSNSPCINAGDPNGSYAGQVDIDGDDRVVDSAADMGADEFVAAYNIDQDQLYSSIQSAIDSSNTNETIEVLPDTYYENLVFNGRSITVQSLDPQDPQVVAETVINGNSGIVVNFRSKEEVNTVLAGFTITNGSSGIYCQYGSNPTINNCVITNNNTPYNGGGIFCWVSSFPTVNNCIITNNTAGYYGGGYYGGYGGSAQFHNSIIADNYAAYSGGAVYCHYSTTRFDNCTIINNEAGSSGGAIYLYSSNPSLTNSIIWGNTAPVAPTINTTGSTFYYSDIEGSGGSTSWNPSFGTDGGGNIDADPLFTSVGDYHLTLDSPCVNAGDPAGDYTGQTDIDQQPRVLEGLPDIGADEFAPPVYNTTVATWHMTIQDAIDNAIDGDIIEVSDGTHTGAGNRDINFLNKGITLRSANGPANCILDAQGSQGDQHHVFGLTSTQDYNASIIGFTITGGNTTAGGGISLMGTAGKISNILVENCIITSNIAYVGGGIHTNYNNLIINNCLISQNTIENSGGGIWGNYSNLVINNSTIVENTCNSGWGGGINLITALCNITNSIFWGNTAALYDQIFAQSGYVSFTNSDIQDGWTGLGDDNIDLAPLFVAGPYGDYYLSQIAAGQGVDSPCFNAGSDTAENISLDDLTTRTDEIGDSQTVDIGYHYPVD